MGECVWSNDEMILGGANRSTGTKTCPSAIMSTTNLTWQYWQAAVLLQSRYDHGSCMTWPSNIMDDLQSGKAMFWTNSTEDSRSWDTKRFSVPRILRYPKVHYRINNRPTPVSIPSQIIPAYASTYASTHFLKTHCNIMPPTTSRSSKLSLSLSAPPVSQAYHTTCPSGNVLNSKKSFMHHR